MVMYTKEARSEYNKTYYETKIKKPKKDCPTWTPEYRKEYQHKKYLERKQKIHEYDEIKQKLEELSSKIE